ncbi:MAG TPA: hypothetical protein VIX84_11820, partial [Acidimicrobiales bacterium]
FALPTLWFTVDFELRRGPDGHFDGLMVSIEETHIPFRRLPECAAAGAGGSLDLPRFGGQQTVRLRRSLSCCL